MKKLAIILTVASLFILSACNKADSEVVVETTAGNITKEEFYEAMKDRFGEDVLTLLVNEKVLSKKYTLSDEEIQTEFDNFKTQFPEQFANVVEVQGEDVVKQMIKVDLLRMKVAEAEVEVTNEDLKSYYKTLDGKVHASHILVPDETKAKEVADKLAKGENFEDLANEYSIDPSAAQNSGDLGWFGKDEMVPEFDKVVFTLKEGEVSEPVKTKFGYHIIKVTETVKPFNEMKESLKETVHKQKIQQPDIIQTAVDKALKDANVEVKDQEFKDLFKPHETEKE
ncbi:peptidylprolyl isomerase [Metabacillus rhizolycopersici]|uniref:Foldase protein PrsA n=1 Tax=Metabacillus rhizolycopersici TaxID=2875709 RepID=A0ABS7UR79_9BACI|nr:peptidylprolyl isomerase [Metabacillus rhizolycopersici]MBZ5750811.1 peptidylprolyl isomerase [Metabacillus rhizolycopersici]